ncbi:MAG: DUF1800 domain-containing protein [Cyclobacteriaceae bacterium]
MAKLEPSKAYFKLEPQDPKEIHSFYENQGIDFLDRSRGKAAPERVSTSTGLSPYQGEWGKAQVLHLLKRVLFGVKPSDLERFSQMSLSQCLDQLIKLDLDPPEPINNYTEDPEFDEDVALGESWVRAPKRVNEVESARVISLMSWLVRNVANQPSTIHEKLFVFWHNLLPTDLWGVFDARASYQYFKLLRKNSLGNYKELIKQLTKEPAMLMYLNGTRNRVGAPDENYARELQELFTVGKGSGSGYTESDVQEAARLLTGYVVWWNDRLTPGERKSHFHPQFHDAGDKQFSSFYGNRVIKGRSGEAGEEELNDLLDMIFEVNEVSKYICRRLYAFFVFSSVDESVEINVIEPLAQLFRDSNYEIEPVIKALLGSEHFFDKINKGAMIKSPLDHLLGFWRATDTDEVEPENNFILFWLYRGIHAWYLQPTGMGLGLPPSVAGWPPTYQTPSLDKIWITTDSITTRAESIGKMINGNWWVWHDGRYLKTDLVKFAESLPEPSDPNKLIKDTWDLLMGIDPSDQSLQHLKSVLLSDQSEDYYWTSAWNQYQSNKSSTTFRQTVETRLQAMIYSLSQLGEFQLM